MPEILRSHSEEETFHIGRIIGRLIEPPKTILLVGKLGTGKTVLTKGICAGLGVRDITIVHSPTFSLVNQYSSPTGPIFHLDLYRLETLRDLYSIGIEEVLATEGVVVVEWAEKLGLNVQSPLTIHLESTDPGEGRILTVEPSLGIEDHLADRAE